MPEPMEFEIIPIEVETGARIALAMIAGSQMTGFLTMFGIWSILVPSPWATAPPKRFSR